MRLTQKEIDSLHISYNINGKTHLDIETIHQNFDNLARLRLMELDPEYLAELEKEVEDITFWYA